MSDSTNCPRCRSYYRWMSAGLVCVYCSKEKP
jgi:hypothetical protein